VSTVINYIVEIGSVNMAYCLNCLEKEIISMKHTHTHISPRKE